MALAILLRHDDSPAAAWWGFLAGGTLWAWVQAALYGGWLVGPGAPVNMALPTSRVAEAFAALRSTAWSDLASLGVLLVTAGLAVGARNRMPFWTVLILWSAHQIARLNVFLGVANAGADLLPQHLAFLKQFFGPASNSPLLPVSVLLWLAIAVFLARWGWRAGTLFQRRAGLVLGVLAALAALEHLFLGLPLSLPLWNSFLSGRAGG
jgi:putative photosynthetic complex assembly protein 2